MVLRMDAGVHSLGFKLISAALSGYRIHPLRFGVRGMV